MYRITSNEVQGLMEAYNAVYTPQELTEEQIWEEVETWVNSLVEEGYDLSDYTWEEMYEAYLNEMGQTRTTGQATAPISTRPSMSAIAAGGGQAALRKLQSQGMSPRSAYARVYSQGEKNLQKPGAAAMGTGMYGRYAPPSTQVRTPASAPTRPAAPAPAARPAAPAPAARPAAAPAPAARPAAPAPAARPAAPAPAAARPATPRPKPTPTTPKPDDKKGPTGMPLVGGIERRIPTSPELKAAQEKRAAQKSVASSFTSAPISGAPKYAPPVFNLKQSYDLYDVIKGHLLDEGYADTEEAAEAIMVSMSEDWRESILEQVTGTGLGQPMEGPTPGNVSLTDPPSVPNEPKKRLPKLTAPPPVPPAKIPPLPPVK